MPRLTQLPGIIPPPDSVPEQEVFVGPVAIAPYDTPGTQAFAETIRPFVERHNSILLENHGVVCWADTITHAEWFVEVLDTYCRTLIMAMHLGAPVKRIAPQKIQEILDIKKQLGLPDARFTSQPESNAYSYPKPRRAYLEAGNAPRDFEFLVRSSSRFGPPEIAGRGRKGLEENDWHRDEECRISTISSTAHLPNQAEENGLKFGIPPPVM